MDVNRFKSINDQYGHGEGDRALRITADELKIICDDFDVFLARYGVNGLDTADKLIAAADKALYDEKAQRKAG